MNCRLFLPDTPECCGRADDEADVLYRLLRYGRANESHFDLRHSPLSLFIYRSIDDETVRNAVTAARSFFNGEEDPHAFLAHLPSHLVEVIARASAHMAFTRRDALTTIAEEYGNGSL